jgi:tetratricopeptide (TPR) repeat protein
VTDGDHWTRHDLFAPLVQRELRLLIVLSLASAALFAGTRSLARWSRQANAREAAGWYARGQSAASLNAVDGAVAALRRAVAANRNEPAYVLALARALTAQGGRDEARRMLLQLREAHPDDVEINYRLARIEAADGAVPEAIRYYNHALYGLAPAGSTIDRFQLRVELITMLLDHDRRGAAVPELAALAREVPDRAPERLQLAQLAERAGNTSRAFEQYADAARLDPTSAAAASGAARMAIARDDFTGAAPFLEAELTLAPGDAAAARSLTVVRLAGAADPLAPRLTARERARRAAAGATWAVDRLSACGPALSPADAASAASLRGELLPFERPAAGLDADALTSRIEAIGRALTATAPCGPQDATAEAWAHIVRAHAEGK